eukprot:m.126905 g.126905  ORF g.126905 m.126905 type:complete len:265 (+) comp17397_c0_seq1:336-1130(+)
MATHSVLVASCLLLYCFGLVNGRTNEAINGFASRYNCVAPQVGTHPEIDLKVLMNNEKDYQIVSRSFPENKFTFNICRSTVSPAGKCTSTTAVCERRRDTNIGVADYGDVATTQIEWAGEAVIMNMSGDICETDRNLRKISRIFFVCKEDAFTPVVVLKAESFYGCYVEIMFYTTVMCKGPVPPPPPSPPPPSPPAPPPPTETLYKCENDRCTVAEQGVNKTECELICVPPAEKLYKCENEKCVESSSGVNRTLCETICTQRTP